MPRRYCHNGVVDGRLLTDADGVARCWWCGDDPDYVTYHDHEWGRPTRDEQEVFELLNLEGFQAGLAWITVLRKRPAFREAFDGFGIETVAAYGEPEIERLLGNADIIRHRGKIEATIANAQATLTLHDEGTSLSELVWSFAPEPRSGRIAGVNIPNDTPESGALSKELKRRGFRFVGPTTVYAFMQSGAWSTTTSTGAMWPCDGN